jgi:ketosteroid isomerase-like protein
MGGDADRAWMSSKLIIGGTMPGDLPITETSVVEFLKRFEAASATRLFANVVEWIHPHALFRFNDGDFRGIEAIQRAFERTWTQDIKAERYTLADIQVVNVDAASAVATFVFHWSGVGSQGPFQIAGRGTSLLVLHNGRLKVRVEHLSR